MRLAQLLISTLLVWLVYDLAARRFDKANLGSRAGLAAGLACALEPALVHYAHFLWSEGLAAALLIFSLWWLERWDARHRDARHREARHRAGRSSPALLIAAGATLGLTALTKEVWLYFVFVVAAWVVWRLRPAWSKAAISALLVVLAAGAVVLPWTVRNTRNHEALVLISTCRWFPIAVGNLLPEDDWLLGDGRGGEVRQKAPAGLSELEAEAYWRDIALGAIRAEQPAWLAKKVVRNTVRLWSVHSQTIRFIENGWIPGLSRGTARLLLALEVALYVLILAAGIAGLWLIPDPAFKPLVLAAILLTVGVHVLANAIPRFHLPVLPLFALYAGALVTLRSAPRAPWRWAGAGITLAVFALLLALGWERSLEPAIAAVERLAEAPNIPADQNSDPNSGETSDWGYHSVQLHLHGSSSEGAGSMAGQTAAAKELGVDALWWTDHDWRIARHTFVDGFDFDRLEERLTIPYRGMPWSKRPRRVRIAWVKDSGGEELAQAEQRLSEERIQGARALELAVAAKAGKAGWGWTGGHLNASGGRFARSLSAGISVDLELRAAQAFSDNAQLEIRFELSHQPGGPAEIVYRVGDPGPRRLQRADGRLVGVVPIELGPTELGTGLWTRLSLPLTEDATSFGLGGEDNSLRRIELRLKARRGAAATVLVDALRLRAQRAGGDVLARQQAWLEETFGDEPGPVHHVGLELSYGVHMNAFLPHPELPDFVHHIHGMGPRETVAWVHERGGLVSYNHIFGAGDEPEEEVQQSQAKRGELAVREAVFGADLLEVGYPQRVLPLAEHLAVWDRLSARGVIVTGIGTSDSHHQAEGWKDGNNFLTWVWSAGLGREALIEGLACGRAFFGDPAHFAGPLELRTAEGRAMGQVIEPGDGSHRLVVESGPLPAGATLRWIVDGQRVHEEHPPPGLHRSQLEVTVGDPSFARVEVWLGESGLAFTNPIYFNSAPESGAACRHEP